MWLRSSQVLLTRTVNALYMLSPAHIATGVSIGMSSYSCKHRPCAGHSTVTALPSPWQRKPEHADTSSTPIMQYATVYSLSISPWEHMSHHVRCLVQLASPCAPAAMLRLPQQQ